MWRRPCGYALASQSGNARTRVPFHHRERRETKKGQDELDFLSQGAYSVFGLGSFRILTEDF
jgi:hypothetical protein